MPDAARPRTRGYPAIPTPGGTRGKGRIARSPLRSAPPCTFRSRPSSRSPVPAVGPPVRSRVGPPRRGPAARAAPRVRREGRRPRRGGGGLAKDPESIPLRTIFVTIHPGGDPKLPALRTKEQALARAREAQAKVKAPGASFAAIATEMSDDPISAADEGFASFVAPWTMEAAGDPEGRPGAGGRRASRTPWRPRSATTCSSALSREEGKALENRHCCRRGGLPRAMARHGPEPARDADQGAGVRGGGEGLGGAQGQEDHERRGPGADRRRACPSTRGSACRASPASRPWRPWRLKTPVGQWTDPIETSRGWAVVQRRPYLRAYVRHILVSHKLSQAPVPRTDRLPQEARTRAEEALAMRAEGPLRLGRGRSRSTATRRRRSRATASSGKPSPPTRWAAG